MITIKDKILLFPVWLFSLLPLRVLYLFAYFLYFLLYYVVGYRKKVVSENLLLSFPEYTEKERKLLSKKFYHYFCQYFIESIYLLSMSKKECSKRYKYENPELIRDIIASGKNVIIASSHFGNWEWAADLNSYIGCTFYGTYRPLY